MSKFPKRVSSAALELESSDGRLLIVKAHYKSHWSLPSGIIDPGETPFQAAIRETKEEVGLTIDPSCVEFSRVVSRHSNSADTYQFVFKASLPDDYEQYIRLQASEIAEYALVSKEDVAKQERPYGKVIIDWADDTTGYVEQTLAQ